MALEDFLSLTWQQNHELGRRHFNEGRYFPAHEAWEAAWRQNKGTPDAEFFKGLAQLGAGYVHLLRGNAHGAVTLLGRAASRLKSYGGVHLDIDCTAIVERCTSDSGAIVDGELIPGPQALSNLLSEGRPRV